MKKLLYTIACSFIAINGFSQKNFSQIEFRQVKTTSGSPNLLDYGIYANKNTTSKLKVDLIQKTGTININAKDSAITVKMEGSEDKVFKISQISEEDITKYKKKTYRKLEIACKNKTGGYFTLKISRDDDGEKINQMDVSILQSNGDGDEYTCTYIKNLF